MTPTPIPEFFVVTPQRFLASPSYPSGFHAQQQQNPYVIWTEGYYVPPSAPVQSQI